MKWAPEWLPELSYKRESQLRVECDDCGWESDTITIPSRIFKPDQVSRHIVSELGDQKCDCPDPLTEALGPNLIELA